jgi:serine/threonine protein kinase
VIEKPGTVIGPYKLLQQIGEGGMGVVFMAEQTEPIQRSVALKIIKPGMDTRQVIARFEAERQALAMMDHPNIAKVLDAGMTEPASGYPGRPYFVMELVKGVPITEFCDEKKLSVRERMELLLPVCEAVQHAHQKGIIHRDIKPTNVLVAEYDSHAVPKVIDFGVAKATAQKLTERTMFTEFGQLVGTFEYMSPEQAKLNQLDIDTRSDIYSLGVLLYELLTGSTPFERNRIREATFDEVLRIIREEEPPTASTRLCSSKSLASIAANRRTEPAKLSKELRGDLDWIVAKALEKDRNRRYETANGLALDVERYLDDQPVEARPPTRSYRFKKLVRRHKAAMIAGTAVVTALLAAIVILLFTNSRIRQEVRARNQALEAKNVALEDKDAALSTAREAVDRMLTQVASEQFSNMPLSHSLRIALLEDAMAFYERLAGQMGSDASLRHEIANVLHANAGLLREVGRYDHAVSALRQARDLLQTLARTDPNPPTLLEELANVEIDLAFTLHRGDEAGLLIDREAEAQYRRALKLYDQLERQWPGRCEPTVLGRRMLARLALERGNMREALASWRTGISQGEAWLKNHPGQLDITVEVGWTAIQMYDGVDDDSLASLADIDSHLMRAAKSVDAALVSDPRSTRVADVAASLHFRRALLHCRQGKVDDAMPQFDKAVSGIEKLCEGFPLDANYWNSLRWFQEEMVRQLSSAGRPAAADEAVRQFEDWLERVAADLADDPSQHDQLRRTQALHKELQRSFRHGPGDHPSSS